MMNRAAVIAIVLLLAFAAPARAQLGGTDTAPGSSCAGFPNGATRMTADADQDGAQVVLICNGMTWNAVATGGNEAAPIIDKIAAQGTPIDPVTIAATNNKWPDYIVCDSSSGLPVVLLLAGYSPAAQLNSVGYLMGSGVFYEFSASGAFESAVGTVANCGASANDIDSICDDGRCHFLGGGGSDGSGGLAGFDREIQFNSGGVFGAGAAFVYTSAGNVGIGTATPGDNLHVYDPAGRAKIIVEGGGSSQSTMDFITGGDGASELDDGAATGWQFYTYNDSYTVTRSQNDFALAHFDGAWKNYVYADSEAGRIGLFKTEPDVALDVAGIIRVIDDAAICTGTQRGAIRFNSAGSALELCDGAAWGSLGGDTTIDRIVDADGDTSVNVDTAGDGSANTISFRLLGSEIGVFSAGGIGAGTSDPRGALDLVYSGGTGTNDMATLWLNNSTVQGSAQMIMGEGPANNFYGMYSRYYSSVDGATNYLAFGSLLNGIDAGEHLIIDRDSGFIGIGTVSPIVELDIVGNARISEDLVVSENVAIGGIVGVGTANPQAALDVAGGVKVGNDSDSCVSAKEGTLRYAGGDPPWEYCDGTTWNAMSGGGSTDFVEIGTFTVSGTAASISFTDLDVNEVFIVIEGLSHNDSSITQASLAVSTNNGSNYQSPMEKALGPTDNTKTWYGVIYGIGLKQGWAIFQNRIVWAAPPQSSNFSTNVAMQAFTFAGGQINALRLMPDNSSFDAGTVTIYGR